MPVGPFPEPGPRDQARSVVVSGGVGALPFVGPALATFIDIAVQPTYERRQAEWFAKLEQLLNEVETRLGTLEHLEGDEEFMTALAMATRTALGTHLEAKLDLLKAVLTRVAQSPERDIRHVHYLYLVDTLEPEHVEVLRALEERRLRSPRFVSPTFEGHYVSGDIEGNRVTLHDVCSGDEAVAEIVARRLASLDLLEIYTPPVDELAGQVERPFTRRVVGLTNLGREFLDYLTVV